MSWGSCGYMSQQILCHALLVVSVGVQALLSTLLILAASYAFHFDVMWQNIFWLSFLLLLMTNLALVAFCFFIRWNRVLQRVGFHQLVIAARHDSAARVYIEQMYCY